MDSYTVKRIPNILLLLPLTPLTEAKEATGETVKGAGITMTLPL